jgi:RND family efflux transporter MFP subunit
MPFGHAAWTALILLVFTLTWTGGVSSAQSVEAVNAVLSGMMYEARVYPSDRAFVANSVNGPLSAIHFTPGGYVEKGQLLFELGDRSYSLRVEAAKAALARRKVELEMARSNLNRTKNLGARGIVAAAALEESEYQLALAAVAFTEAQAQLALAEFKLTSATIVAPISGFIDMPRFPIGAYLKTETGQALAEITRIDPALISFQWPYGTLLDLHKAAPKKLHQLLERSEVTVTLPTGEKLPQKGRLLFSANSLDTTDKALEVWAEIPNPDYVLVPGLTVNVNVRIAE